MSDPTKKLFLGKSQRIEQPDPDTVLLCAPFDIDAFDQGLFNDLAIPFPVSLSNAIPKRRADFLAGRALVARAFEALGLPAAPVDIGPDRAPIWPPNVSGSISHSRETCACLVSRTPTLRLGIDIETDLSARSDKAVRKIALDDTERQLIDAHSHDLHLPALVFSAKETLFKALYPIVQEIFGFGAAQIACVPDDQHITLTLTRSLHPTLPAGMAFDIRYERLDTQFLTWLIYEV